MGKTQSPDCSISPQIINPDSETISCNEKDCTSQPEEVPRVKDVIFFVDNGARKNDFRVENEFDFLDPLHSLDETYYSFEGSSEDESKKDDPLGSNSGPTTNNLNEEEEEEDVERANDDDGEKEHETADDTEEESSTDEEEKEEDDESAKNDAREEIERSTDGTKEEVEGTNDNDDFDRDRRGRVGEISEWDSDGSNDEENDSEGSNKKEERNIERKSGNSDSESDFDEFEEDEGVEGRIEEEEIYKAKELSSERDKGSIGDNKFESQKENTERENELSSKCNIEENISAQKHSSGEIIDDRNNKCEFDEKDAERDKEVSSEEDHLKENKKRKRISDIADDIVDGKKSKLDDEDLKAIHRLKRKAYDAQLHASLHMAFLSDWVSDHSFVHLKNIEPEEDEEVNILYEEIEIPDDDDDMITPGAIQSPRTDVDTDVNTKGDSENFMINQSMGQRVSLVQGLSSINLERKSIIIGGNVKRILSAKDFSSRPGQPVKTILHNGQLKVVLKQTPGNGSSLLKSSPKELDVALEDASNSMKSILKPGMTKTEAMPGTFIKLSDLKSTNISEEKVPGQSNPNSLLKNPISGGTSLTQSNIKVLQKIPVSEAKSGGQTTLKIIPKSLISSQTNIKAASLLKSSPTLLTTSQPNSQKLLKLTPMASSPNGIPITSKLVSSNLRCEFCKILFLKPESLRIHQLARHMDKLKNRKSESLTPPTANQPKITLPTSSKYKKITLPTISQPKILNGTECVPLNNGNKLIIIPKNILQKKKPQNELPPPDSSEETKPVTFSDLLELERELKDRSGNCKQCISGKYLVSDLKKHARMHPYGDENCEICMRSISFHKKYLSHLESHAPESIESISDSEMPEEILSD